MTGKDAGKSLLENAYALSTPDDNVAYYRSFAATYDSDFADGMGWNYPAAVARAYYASANQGELPIADIGCGTGFVAQELGLAPEVVDGMDISPEMLRVAAGKGLYRDLYEVDLSGSLTAIANDYGAVLSAGTFTHGHLGPGPLRGLLSIARTGALFIIGVNKVHYEALEFSTVLNELAGNKAIDAVRVDEVKMYSKPDHEHSDDTALLLTYRKL